MQDAPFMALLAVVMLAFAICLGLYLSAGFLETRNHANAVDSIEKICYTSDLLSSGTSGSTRTIWIDLPSGYSIDFQDGHANLRNGAEHVGEMKLSGVAFTGGTIEGGRKHHLLLSFKVDSFGNSKVEVSEI